MHTQQQLNAGQSQSMYLFEMVNINIIIGSENSFLLYLLSNSPMLIDVQE